MPFDSQAFGKRLNQYRKDRKVTSNMLGEAVHVNPSHIRQIESGKRSPSIDSLVDICNALEISPDDLMADSLGDYARGQQLELYTKIMRLTPNQWSVAMATIDALLKTQE